MSDLTANAQALRAASEAFCQKDDRIAALHYFGTFAFYFLTLWAAVAAWPMWWLTLPLIVVNGLSGVRLYVLQHDTGHASLFTTTRRNDLAGYALSTFTLTPYKPMRYNHNAHHAFLGNLDHRDTTEIFTMTLAEWQEAGFWKRLFYRLYRNPLLMLPLGGLYAYLIAYRFPKNTFRTGISAQMVHNAALVAWWLLLYVLGGWTALGVYLSTVFVAGCIGVFLVYLQHNFEDTYWDHKPELSFVRATLLGSSTLDFGAWFDFAVANITHHALHHFNPRIPSYRLREAHLALKDEFGIRTIRFPEALASFRLKLWDEQNQRLVPFSAARAPRGARSTVTAT